MRLIFTTLPAAWRTGHPGSESQHRLISAALRVRFGGCAMDRDTPQGKCCKATSFWEALTQPGRLSWRGRAVHSCHHSSRACLLATAYFYDFTCIFLLWLLSEIPLHLRLYLFSQARVTPGGLLCFSHGAAIPTLYPSRVRAKRHFVHGSPLVFTSIGEKKRFGNSKPFMLSYLI